jgi:hypothetical protein
MLYQYARILDVCEPYLIAHRGVVDELNRCPLGVQIRDELVFDPQLRRNGAFLALLHKLDALTLGPLGMTMPSWVFYDCAVMPGAFFGLGIRRDRLERWALEALGVPDDYDGLVPVSQCIAIPKLAAFAPDPAVAGGEAAATTSQTLPETLPEALPETLPETWLLYSLESINQVSPGFAPAGLLKLTLALGLAVFPIKRLYGVTQWRSPKLDAYIDLGPIELMTAYTPAHSLPRTLTFRLQQGEIMLETLLTSPRVHPLAAAPDTLLDPDDPAALIALQHKIEAGWRVRVVGHPMTHGSQIRVPLAMTPPEGR